MSTLRQLESTAKEEFTPFLMAVGFEKKGSFSFVRRRGEFFDVIAGDMLRSGNNLRVRAGCWLPEVNPQLGVDRFVRDMSFVTGGVIGFGRFPGGGDLWDVSTVPKLEETLSGLKKCIEILVLPWFDSITTRAAFVNAVDPNVKDGPAWPGMRQRLLSPS